MTVIAKPIKRLMLNIKNEQQVLDQYLIQNSKIEWEMNEGGTKMNINGTGMGGLLEFCAVNVAYIFTIVYSRSPCRFKLR